MPTGVQARHSSRDINRLMDGPTANHCPDCSESGREVARSVSSGEFSSYSNAPQTRRMIETLRRNLTRNCDPRTGCRGSRRPGSVGRCLRYVKFGMLGNYTNSYPPGLHAKDFGGQLQRMGFRNLKSDSRFRNMRPEQAPEGAILVYSGGPSGHIEVKAGPNEYLSDFRDSRPISERLPRRLIGVYVK
jgi:hypothetical protein